MTTNHQETQSAEAAADSARGGPSEGSSDWAISLPVLRSTMGTLEMLELDLAYVRSWSFWTDLMILLRTVPTLLRGHGAR